jgi:hypothetical protein
VVEAMRSTGALPVVVVAVLIHGSGPVPLVLVMLAALWSWRL